jgi:hypothetical protein
MPRSGSCRVEDRAHEARCEDRNVVNRFHVRYVGPTGWLYEMWPSAGTPEDAVRRADELLEYVERVGISDFLEADGVSVRRPAQLAVVAAENPTQEEFAVRCTRPDGTVARQA